MDSSSVPNPSTEVADTHTTSDTRPGGYFELIVSTGGFLTENGAISSAAHSGYAAASIRVQGGVSCDWTRKII